MEQIILSVVVRRKSRKNSEKLMSSFIDENTILVCLFPDVTLANFSICALLLLNKLHSVIVINFNFRKSAHLTMLAILCRRMT